MSDWEEYYHKIHDEFRDRLDAAEHKKDDLVKHSMLVLATILGLSLGLSSFGEKIVDITYLKISWLTMLYSLFIGAVYLIYSGKRYRHNKCQELRTLSDISLVNMDREKELISKDECDILTIAAHHNCKRCPDISNLIKNDFYKKNEKIINEHKLKLPSSKSLIRNEADLANKKFNYFMASNSRGFNFSFYAIYFISFLFLIFHIILAMK